jgi:methylated-DNA-[protein]-cysteine S-methyltransferase
MQHRFFEHPQGSFALVADRDQLVGVMWRDNREETARDLNAVYPASREESSTLLENSWSQIESYLAGERTQWQIPIEIRGVTPFQKRVLQALQNCRYGETLTYGELAERAGSPRAARAVGAAMAANPLPLLIPCHRVIGAGLRLTGYSGGRGIASKKYLLELENR